MILSIPKMYSNVQVESILELYFGIDFKNIEYNEDEEYEIIVFKYKNELGNIPFCEQVFSEINFLYSLFIDLLFLDEFYIVECRTTNNEQLFRFEFIHEILRLENLLIDFQFQFFNRGNDNNLLKGYKTIEIKRKINKKATNL